jgi:hypothetical protein
MSRFLRSAAIWVIVIGTTFLPATAVHADDPTASPTPAPVETPAPTQPAGNSAPDRQGGLLGFLPDPKQWAAEVFNQVLVNLLQGLSTALRNVVGGVLGSSLNFITQTPPAGTYASPTVQTLWTAVRTTANAALVLVALWGGFNLISDGTVSAPRPRCPSREYQPVVGPASH